MENAAKLAKIRDHEYESSFGSVYSVSGPGKSNSTPLSPLLAHTRSIPLRP
jgi:hypothetical protein